MLAKVDVPDTFEKKQMEMRQFASTAHELRKPPKAIVREGLYRRPTDEWH